MEPGDVRAGRGEAQPSGRSPTAAWPGLTLCLRKFPAESPGQKLWSRMSECWPDSHQVTGGRLGEPPGY